MRINNIIFTSNTILEKYYFYSLLHILNYFFNKNTVLFISLARSISFALRNTFPKSTHSIRDPFAQPRKAAKMRSSMKVVGFPHQDGNRMLPHHEGKGNMHTPRRFPSAARKVENEIKSILSEATEHVTYNPYTLQFASHSLEEKFRAFLRQGALRRLRIVYITLTLATSLGVPLEIWLMAEFSDIVFFSIILAVFTWAITLYLHRVKKLTRRAVRNVHIFFSCTNWVFLGGVCIPVLLRNAPGKSIARDMMQTMEPLLSCANQSALPNWLNVDWSAFSPVNKTALEDDEWFAGPVKRTRYACVDKSNDLVRSIAYYDAEFWDQHTFNAYFLLMIIIWGFLNLVYLITTRIRFRTTVLVILPPGLTLFSIIFASHPRPSYTLVVFGLGVLPCLFLVIFIPFSAELALRANFLQDMRLKELLIGKEAKIGSQQLRIKHHEDQIRRANLLLDELSSEDKRFDEIMAHRDIQYDQLTFSDEALGEGAFGVVRKATYYDEVVAVKMLRIGQALNKDAIRKFREEMRILSPLKHHNLCEMIGASWKEGAEKMCIVMQFAGRGSLSNVWKGVGFDPILRELMTQAASCFEYLHALNPPIIHRDIKPENILVTASWNALVADLGSSRTMDSGGGSDTYTLAGTPYYMAPEVIRGEWYDTSCDVYSFGILLLECIVEEHHLTSSARGMERSSGVPVVRRIEVPEFAQTAHPLIARLIEGCCSHVLAQRPSFAEIRKLLVGTQEGTIYRSKSWMRT